MYRDKCLNRIVAVFCALIMIIMFSSCGDNESAAGINVPVDQNINRNGIKFSSSVEKFRELMMIGDDSAAIQQYENKICGKEKKEDEAERLCCLYYDSIFNCWYNGEITVQTAETEFEKLFNIVTPLEISLNDVHFSLRYKDLIESCKNYELGCAAYELKDYQQAILCFEKVIDIDRKYNYSQLLIKDSRCYIKLEELDKLYEEAEREGNEEEMLVIAFDRMAVQNELLSFELEDLQ